MAAHSSAPSRIHARALDRPLEVRRGPLAFAIKRRTALAHRTAEAAVLGVAPFRSREDYQRYLRRLYGFYEAVEPRVTAALAGVIDMSLREKRHWLAEDLRQLGDEADLDTLPRCTSLPRVSSVGAALGVAYVLEGKTLGARFLIAEARTQLDLDIDSGARFLAGYGDRTAAMWNDFRAALEAVVDTRGQRTAVIRGASEAFAAFVRWVQAG